MAASSPERTVRIIGKNKAILNEASKPDKIPRLCRVMNFIGPKVLKISLRAPIYVDIENLLIFIQHIYLDYNYADYL
jgi:hypothetical protein